MKIASSTATMQAAGSGPGASAQQAQVTAFDMALEMAARVPDRVEPSGASDPLERVGAILQGDGFIGSVQQLDLLIWALAG